MEAFKAEKESTTFMDGVKETFGGIFKMPKTMKQLAFVQFFTWFALFAMWIYATNAVTANKYNMKVDKTLVDKMEAAVNSGIAAEKDQKKTKALNSLKSNKYDVVVTDLRLPGTNGLDILKSAKEIDTNIIVIIITAYATIETAIESLKLGAYDYLLKPFSPEQLLSILKHIEQLSNVLSENVKLKSRLELFEKKNIIGSSTKVKAFLDMINMIAPQDYTVLIQG